MASFGNERQAFGCHERARILEFLVESVHESEVCLEVFLRPFGIPFKIGLVPVIRSMYFMALLLSILEPGCCSFNL